MTWRWGILGMIAMGTIVLAIGFGRWYHQEWAIYHGFTPLPFSREAWMTASPDARGQMLEDLLAKHPLKGLTSVELQNLLGPPDRGGERGATYEVGYRGYNRRAPMVFPYTLFIDYDRQGRVEHVYLGD